MRVVVTGAAGDPTCSQPLSIGAAAAIELARSAEAMWLIDRNGPGLRWTKEQLPAAIDVELVECDPRDPAQLEAALAGVVSDDVAVSTEEW
jgi:NAD(P)-dependent dehydrogenase (short-subunit alcohol dehydrogenase family)